MVRRTTLRRAPTASGAPCGVSAPVSLAGGVLDCDDIALATATFQTRLPGPLSYEHYLGDLVGQADTARQTVQTRWFSGVTRLLGQMG